MDEDLGFKLLVSRIVRHTDRPTGPFVIDARGGEKYSANTREKLRNMSEAGASDIDVQLRQEERGSAMETVDRRDFLRLAAVGGIVFASSLQECATRSGGSEDFHFVQLSDIHWGYDNAAVNPDFKGTLPKAIAAVNGLAQRPDFVVFTGDLTQTTDNPAIRRARLSEFRDIASRLDVPKVYFFAGEHDASLDRGDAYQELFGETLRYTFDHKGIHFVVAFRNVTVFYGHIHHEHHHVTGNIAHHAAMSTMFPLSPLGTAEKKTQLPWNAQQPYKGLGYRTVRVDLIPGKFVEITLIPRKAGRFHYLCDNFCGEGHDKMSGMLIVPDA